MTFFSFSFFLPLLEFIPELKELASELDRRCVSDSGEFCELDDSLEVAAETMTNFSSHDTFSSTQFKGGPLTTPPASGAPMGNLATTRASFSFSNVVCTGK